MCVYFLVSLFYIFNIDVEFSIRHNFAHFIWNSGAVKVHGSFNLMIIFYGVSPKYFMGFAYILYTLNVHIMLVMMYKT